MRQAVYSARSPALELVTKPSKKTAFSRRDAEAVIVTEQFKNIIKVERTISWEAALQVFLAYVVTLSS
jgi:hypothetical protein